MSTFDYASLATIALDLVAEFGSEVKVYSLEQGAGRPWAVAEEPVLEATVDGVIIPISAVQSVPATAQDKSATSVLYIAGKSFSQIDPPFDGKKAKFVDVQSDTVRWRVVDIVEYTPDGSTPLLYVLFLAR